ncbi:MAG TPA: hypothetical protein VKC15_12515 [Gemmatimonadales bacterium]|nr:hypothetical protein [Gemmatimonadales bacterium]
MRSIKRSLKTDNPAIPEFNINQWLEKRGNLVTRGELWEFISRLEYGKRMRNRWQSRLRRFGRRLWGWLTFNPLVDVEDQVYR